MILKDVAEYIQKCKDESKDEKPYPLHKYIHHGLSSQAMVFNLIGPLIKRNDFAPLVKCLQAKGVDMPIDVKSGAFEFEDRKVFNEDSGQPTSIDVVLKDEKDQPMIFIESKLVEKVFGGCSVFAGGDCDGRNPVNDKQSCYLHYIGRKYWDLLEEYGFSSILENEKQCVFSAYYQFFREVLLSLDKNGVFVLLSDERSPVFYCKGKNGKEKGLMPFLMDFVPEEHKSRIAAISVQEVVEQIKKSNRHQDWIGIFEKKYDLINGHK
ncbi:MAG: hypothetical protein HQK83_04525 [Fibrobacteria bacterium]|nr:hypothetical protein [Fibrobacteria bacterium]